MRIPLEPENFCQDQLSYQAAVKAAYKKEMDWIESMLRSRLSVRVIAEKSLSLLLYQELRERLVGGSPSTRCVLVQSPPSKQGRSFMHAMVEDLWDKAAQEIGENDSIIVLPHLDLLATTTDSTMGTPTREAIAAMAQDPELTFLAFCDPSLKLPLAIEEIFDVKQELVGIRRDVLPHLITYEEARRFGVDQLNLFRLYKYVSGVHAVKLRKLMVRMRDHSPLIALPPKEREEERSRIERTLREMTLLGGMEIPNVDLHADIGGYEETKKKIQEELLDILTLREHPDWKEFGDDLEETLPRGLLFHGPPGTGKTYFAKAIATSINATTIVVSGPEIKSKWVGETEANLRKIFTHARMAAPALIIFDEIDAIAPQRGTYQGSGVEHSLVNQLLTEMDGFRKEEMVFVVGTTNFLQSVDSALLRPGRFEYHLHIPYPDRQARRAILDIYARKFAFSIEGDVLEHILDRTGAYVDPRQNIRFSGDHLFGIARQLKRLQARKRDLSSPFHVTINHIDEVMGPAPFRSKKKRAYEKRKAAYHEAGHALVAAYRLGPEAIQKVTIMADDPGVEGMVSIHSYVSEGATRQTLLFLIQVALAGRATEELLFEELDIGAKNDLDMATNTARMMVEDLGMSERFGPRVYRMQSGDDTLVGGMTREWIDKEINQLLIEQYQETKTFIDEKRDELERLTAILIEKKELGSHEISTILSIDCPEK